MKINFNTTKFILYKSQQNLQYQNLKPLPFDSVSFTSMKKTQFEEIDLAVINKFQAPIEKFNSNQDLQYWAMDKVYNIMKTDFSGRRMDTIISREGILEDWYVSLYKYKKYPPSVTLLILNDITHDLAPDNDNLPPIFSKTVLQSTIQEIKDKLKKNPKEQINFDRMYRENLKKYYFETEGGLNPNYTGWIIIESKKNSPEQFEENTYKLKALSYKTWCTADIYPERYLEKGDFHIYFEQGKPKIAIRFAGDEIQEIQGEKNDSKIPAQYLDAVIEHTRKHKLSSNARSEINKSINNLKKAIII